METFEIYELPEQIDEVSRIIIEDRETIELTKNGEVIAHIIPVRKPKQTQKLDPEAFLANMNRHAAEIGKHITEESVDAVQIVREGRREL